MSKIDRFVVVEWPECQFFMVDRTRIHLAGVHNFHTEFSYSSYFVETGYYGKVSGQPVSDNEAIYLAVSFPESQLFMDNHQNEILLINDEFGLVKYGNAAYFIEEGLYRKVIGEFQKEATPLPFFNGPNI